MDEQLQLGDSDSLVALKQAWDKALPLLSSHIARPSFESFIRTARPLSIEGTSVVIGAASELAKIFLDKYSHLVKTSLDSQMKADLQVSFAIAPKEQVKPKASETKEAPRVSAVVSSVSLPLNEKYTFENFIPGNGNKMALAIAKAVAMKPGEAYNPVFLFGGPGLGKTHLLQAIGNYAIKHHGSGRVAYVSGEQFTAHYVMALREHRSEDFRRKYRSIDILLVDDIQFLAGKVATNEEFFHTFNALYQSNKQIVLSSDRSPSDLGAVEERLKSRFLSGVVTDIAPPDQKTRVEILQRKASLEDVKIPDNILECVADLVQTNVRALEGALVTLIAYTSLMRTPLDEALVHEVLGRYLSERKRSELAPDGIQRAVAKAFQVEVADIQGAKRVKELVTARHVAMYLSRELTDRSLPQIGKAFGGRNHATVIHACGHVKELMEKDSSLKLIVEQLVEELRSGVV